MAGEILGIHHVTAISGPAQENVDFYAGVLGLRLVKLTVNYDDPSAYHLYYGDGLGSPGSILTFFPYPGGYPGRAGAGQATVTSLAVPTGSMSYWVDRFTKFSVDFDRPQRRHQTEILAFRGPDGLLLELVGATDSGIGESWEGAPVPARYAVVGIRSVLMRVRDPKITAETLIDRLGFRRLEDRDGRQRFDVGEGGRGRMIDVVHDPEGPLGRSGHGTIHHVAFRTACEESQNALRESITESGLHVSPTMDRNYFRSVYFREPGGVLFEIATDPPGFSVDEPVESLGTTLRLPEKFELYRTKIERSLPKLRLPQSN